MPQTNVAYVYRGDKPMQVYVADPKGSVTAYDFRPNEPVRRPELAALDGHPDFEKVTY